MPVDVGPWTQIPNRFFGSGMAAKVKPAAALIYLALCDHANRNSSNTFKASDRALASDTGLAPRTICDARKRLGEHQLILYSRAEGNSYTYTILKPSWNWVPMAERLRAKRKPRACHSLRADRP